MARAAIDAIDTAEIELDTRAARSLPFGGGCAVALGAMIAGLGLVFVLAVGAVVFFVPDGIPRDHRWLVPPALVFLVVVGLGLVRTGVGDWRRAERGKALAARHPGQPWFADAPWDPSGAEAEAALGRAGLFIILFVVLIMGPFNVLWLHVFDPQEDPTRRLAALMVLIPDFFLFLILRGLVSIAKDRIRHGRPRLRFETFPFFLGEALEARLTAKALAGQEGVMATLRCIDERMMSRRDQDGRTDSVQPFQVYLARQAFAGPFAGEDVPLRIPLPAQPSTELLRQPPRYWELEIRGPSGDPISFTVPVYGRP